jgi:hypothetical protein
MRFARGAGSQLALKRRPHRTRSSGGCAGRANASSPRESARTGCWSGFDAGAEGYALAFARAYLSYDAAHPNPTLAVLAVKAG